MLPYRPLASRLRGPVEAPGFSPVNKPRQIGGALAPAPGLAFETGERGVSLRGAV